MDAKTLEALHGSIAKWQAIVDGTGKNEGAKNCPLCLLFLLDEEGFTKRSYDQCAGCPVFERTGEANCCGTPYDEYQFEADYDGDKVRLKELAQAELDFLKSLLPVQPFGGWRY